MASAQHAVDLVAELGQKGAATVADRWDRRRLMIGTNLFCAGAVAVMLLGTAPGRYWVLYAALIAENAVTPSTFALIVTRGHNHDEEALYHVATTPAGYIGMIGSKRKVRLIFDDLLQKGVSEAALARVNAPVGMEIGSQTVPEIAVSIVAELIARRNVGRNE
jgi:xanthine/CO dehydrogenase XdhC/CoxF family maturation factor